MRQLHHPIGLELMVNSCFNRVQVGPVSIPVNGQHHRHITAISYYDLSATDINGQLVNLDR